MKDDFTRAMRKEGWMACRCRHCMQEHKSNDMRRAHRRARSRMRNALRAEVVACLLP